MEDLHIDFDVKCDNRVNKEFATLLVSTIKDALDQVTVSINFMNNNFSKRFDDLEASSVRMRDDIVETAKVAQSALDLANQNRVELEKLRAENAELKLWCKRMETEAAVVKSQTNNIEMYSRRDNIIFYGIPEPQNESSVLCERAVRSFCVNQLKLSENDASRMIFVRCHRLHDQRHKSINPIIVRFKEYSDRERVWTSKTNISDRTLSIGEDFPKDIAYNRRKLFPVFTKARRVFDKKVVSLKADNLLINGKRYTVDNLDELTGELSMKTFSERSNDKVVVVGGIYSNFHPLSNFYSSPITFRNQNYKTLEQGYQHTKALVFGDVATAADIMATNNPALAKKLSYNIKNFKQDAWNTKRHDIMLQLVKAKFNQNPKLADELRATGKKTISESGRHKYFANGLAITNKEILNTLKWTGQSQLGEILMTVRRELPQAVASP